MLLMRPGETTSTTHVAARLQTNYTGGATLALVILGLLRADHSLNHGFKPSAVSGSARREIGIFYDIYD